MKKFYLLIFAAFSYTFAFAQDPVSGCNDPAGGIQLIFDDATGCTPGALAGMAEVGFHSGMNGFMNVIDWNAGTAVTGVNDGNDDFMIYLADVDAYYGQAAGTVTQVDFVLNQGPSDPGNPWSAEGKKDDGGGGCADLTIMLSSITETCEVSASTRDLLLDLDFQVMGNPFTERATVMFSNTDNSVYTARLADATGRILRTYSQINTNQLEIERGNLSSGFYFVTFTNEEGAFATVKLFAR